MKSAKRFMSFALLMVSLTSCGGKGTSATPTAPTPAPIATAPVPAPPSPLGVVDSALLGTWSGSLDGSFGVGFFNMTLSSNGTMLTMNTGGSSNYCPVFGNWGVASGQFNGRGDDCTGTVVTFFAPSSATTMTGTWTASSGRSGTFTITKQ
jgi:predicted small lipoprotein YifL